MNQERSPNEIIIADGCSTDRTVELIRSFNSRGIPIRIVANAKIFAGAGRNAAIREAKYDVIAATDFGIVLDSRWLAEIVSLLEEDPSVDVVAGLARPKVTNEFETYVAAILHTSNSRNLDDFSPEQIQRALAQQPPVPGGNSVAFKKHIWEKAGGYPDWLRTSEDKLFARKVYSLGGKVAVSFKALVYYDPRDTLWNVFRQFYGYGKGNAQSRQISRAFFKLLVESAMGLSLFAMGFLNSFWWYLLGCFVVFHVYRAGFKPYLVIHKKWPGVKGFVWIPLIVTTHHAATILGHLFGYLEQLLNPLYRRKYFVYMNAK
jgi:cellulose synthase/poly-beta-1,6-N-acetylglucosamine synthase-like glycosyltransferase